MQAHPTLTLRLPNTHHRAAVAASVVLGVAVSVRVGTLAADRVARDVGEAVGAAPDEVVIQVGEREPNGVSLELWCADGGWCTATAERLHGDCLPGFVRLSLGRSPLRPA